MSVVNYQSKQPNILTKIGKKLFINELGMFMTKNSSLSFVQKLGNLINSHLC